MHKWNPCAILGMDETTENNMYIDEMIPFLNACGIEWKRGVRRTPKSDENRNSIMYQNVRESNSWGADLHCVSHTDAANGSVRGYRPIIYPTGNSEGEHLAEIMMRKRKEIYDQPCTLYRHSDLYELSNTNAVAYYEEHVFHDNLADDTWFHDNMHDVADTRYREFASISIFRLLTRMHKNILAGWMRRTTSIFADGRIKAERMTRLLYISTQLTRMVKTDSSVLQVLMFTVMTILMLESATECTDLM